MSRSCSVEQKKPDQSKSESKEPTKDISETTGK
jgi:hypothetical protein